MEHNMSVFGVSVRMEYWEMFAGRDYDQENIEARIMWK